jgi:hypothetical protein
VNDFADAEWNQRVRDETPTERLDRNWADLLQELRVAQTGVQLLTGLLLTAVFQQRFTELSPDQRAIYLVTVGLSVLSTATLIAPVAMHRGLFRQHARASLVSTAQYLAITGLGLLGLAVTGVVWLIFAVVAGTMVGVLAGVVTFVVFCLLWAGIPLAYRRHPDSPSGPA